jgi:hypothetical protein
MTALTTALASQRPDSYSNAAATGVTRTTTHRREQERARFEMCVDDNTYQR